MEKVVNLPMDQFVNFALEKQFSEKQMEMLREMRYERYSTISCLLLTHFCRRRGKNLRAAKSCRRKKHTELEVS